MISFIAGGGINTMKMVSQSVMNGIPVMMLADAGGATQFITYGMEEITRNQYLYQEYCGLNPYNMSGKLVALVYQTQNELYRCDRAPMSCK